MLREIRDVDWTLIYSWIGRLFLDGQKDEKKLFEKKCKKASLFLRHFFRLHLILHLILDPSPYMDIRSPIPRKEGQN